ncbi:MAG: biotin transporter BioY [Actinobacteria bacterium]|jgi:biotin transport system substrate-specific component|nr:biotin transporter BioY [Actinomycetota bacterium]
MGFGHSGILAPPQVCAEGGPVKDHRSRATARDLAQIAVFAALIAALGVPGTLYIGGSGVPITLQTMGVMLAGAILGPWKGVASVAVFETLTAVGLPLLAGGRGGPAYFTVQPSAGYAWGFLLGALVVGLGTRAILPKYPLWLGIAVTFLGGMVAIYAVGVPWLAAVTHTPIWAAFVGNLIYVPGDAIKVVATAVVAKQVHRAYPGLIAPRRRAADRAKALRGAHQES